MSVLPEGDTVSGHLSSTREPALGRQVWLPLLHGTDIRPGKYVQAHAAASSGGVWGVEGQEELGAAGEEWDEVISSETITAIKI